MIREIDVMEIPTGRRGLFGETKLRKDVMAFYESGWVACEVDVGGYANAKSAVASYRATVKRCRVAVDVIRRGNRVFLIRGEVK